MELTAARRLILAQVAMEPHETVGLALALHRVCARPLKARLDSPPFTRATRDGYAVSPHDFEPAVDLPAIRLRLAGEIAAGRPDPVAIEPGEAWRIMTGAALPAGADRVIPGEFCQELDRFVLLPATAVASGMFVEQRAAVINKKQVVLERGVRVTPAYLAILAQAGIRELAVHRQPAVAYFCTGSELVDHTAALPGAGQIVCANSPLLSGLIRQAGGRPLDLGIIPDRLELLCTAFEAAQATGARLLITTGGLGPGRYDLVAAAFAQAGGRLLFQSLNVRPGRSTLCGTLGPMLFFGLPGPPGAVNILFDELLRPAILRAQGLRHVLPQTIQAELSEPLTVGKNGFSRLREAVLTIRAGKITARPSALGEAMNAVLVLPAGRCHYKKGATVTVHCHGFNFSPHDDRLK
ncbi:MAG: hypothetical protein A2521_06260 [Deltaproteobacteria bacterium RIFOXYD12_FULL_57_12]|nr:MAG: hypothetical protein A2521_06260 [Deltaproteobacteria bacterium RIFOXYD12_FULL_57_12]